MSRTRGAKDIKPRKKPDRSKVVMLNKFKDQKTYKEGIDLIVNRALEKGLHADLWEMLNCFRRIKGI